VTARAEACEWSTVTPATFQNGFHVGLSVNLR
jgi:hypothetical protein